MRSVLFLAVITLTSLPRTEKLKSKHPEETIGLSITGEVPGEEIPVPGDVVVFDARAWHAVPYVGNRRHVISFLYVDKRIHQGPATTRRLSMKSVRKAYEKYPLVGGLCRATTA
ncbi:MAG: hypothetical protein IPK95_05165 [Cellvibrionales bacterium]|nr:hypothetical protein [Cellvibrionales bacterium]